MKVKIVSDGTAAGTRIETEFGEPIENIVFMQLMISSDSIFNEVILGLENIPCEIITEAKITDRLGVISQDAYGGK